MKLLFSTLILLATPFASGQQIPCAKYDEQQGYNSPKFRMKGCQSFNELQAVGGIKIEKGKWFKSYSCFATTFPEEGEDFFIFATLSGVLSFAHDKEQNGDASMQTFLGGVKVSGGYTPMTWTRYPKQSPFLWSDGTWVGHGDAEMTKWSEETKSLVPVPESNWKVLHMPRLHAFVESDTVRLRLDMNDEKGTVEELRFNRRTGRALLNLGDKERALRCATIEDQN